MSVVRFLNLKFTRGTPETLSFGSNEIMYSTVVNDNVVARYVEATIFETSDVDPLFFLNKLDTFTVQLISTVNFTDTVVSVFVLAVLQIQTRILSKTHVISH